MQNLSKELCERLYILMPDVLGGRLEGCENWWYQDYIKGWHILPKNCGVFTRRFPCLTVEDILEKRFIIKFFNKMLIRDRLGIMSDIIDEDKNMEMFIKTLCAEYLRGKLPAVEKYLWKLFGEKGVKNDL